MDPRSVTFCPVCGLFVHYEQLSYNKDDAARRPQDTECGAIRCGDHYSEYHYVNGSCRERIVIDEYVLINDNSFTIFKIDLTSSKTLLTYHTLACLPAVEKITLSNKEEIENFLLMV